MSAGTPWMLVLGCVPLGGSVLVGALGLAKASDETAKRTAFGVALIELVLTIIACAQFKAHGAVFQFGTSYNWISEFGVHFSLGADGIALALIALTAILTPVVILASWHEAEGGKGSVPTYFALMLALECLLVGVFSATDVFLFYIFFEAMLIPMYFIIGSYGGPQRQYAAVKFLLYSLFGGLLMLSAVIGLYVTARSQGHPTFDFATLTTLHISDGTQDALFLGFFIAFAVKAPLIPFHTWLPDAGAESPVGGAVMLVGVLDKVGTFGFLRYCLPLFPHASKLFAPYILGLCLLGIIYGALVAVGQRDMKRLVSYTSVAHFGFIALGVFAMTSQGGTGAVLYMVNHGLATGALFLAVGTLISRTGSRDVEAYGGVAKVAPLLAGSFFLAGLASLALPGTGSFISEFLTLVGTFTRYKGAAIVATAGIVFAALYVLWAYQRVAQGPVRGLSSAIRDLSAREVWVMAPMLALVIALGVYPKPLIDIINPSVNRTLQQVHRGDPKPTAGVVGDTAGQQVPLPEYGPGTSPFKPGGDGLTPKIDVAIGGSTR